MAITLPYPTMSGVFAPTGGATVDQLIPSSVHSDQVHNNPHAKLLANDNATATYINNTLIPYVDASANVLARVVQSIDNSVVGQYQIGIEAISVYGPWWPKLPIPLGRLMASGFDFNNYGVISWYASCFGGQSDEEGGFWITTGAGVWEVWRERNVRLPVSPGVDSRWRNQYVEFSLKDYRGLSSYLGNYNFADCRKESLFAPTSNHPVYDRQYVTNEPVSAYDADLAYCWFGKHQFVQYGGGSNPVHVMNVYGFWNPNRPALAYPRVGYVFWADLPGGAIQWMPQ